MHTRNIYTDSDGAASLNLEDLDDRLMSSASSLTLVDLRPEPLWVGWRGKWHNGAMDKPMYNPRNDNFAMANYASTWGTRAVVEDWKKKYCGADTLFGQGIVLAPIPQTNLHLGGIDLDTCRDEATGVIEPWAQEVVDRIASYAEISPSLTGVKIFFCYRMEDFQAIEALFDGKFGREFKRGGRVHPPAIEVWRGHRYFTFTEAKLESSPEDLRVVDLAELEWVIKVAGPTFEGSGAGASSHNDNDNRSDETRTKAAGAHDEKSRSQRALRECRRLRRLGKSYEEVREALLKHSDEGIAEWSGTKGTENGERELHRIFDMTGGPAEELTELGNARRLIRRYADDIRYCHTLKAWFIWDGNYWRRDEDGGIYRFAEATVELIFEEAAAIPPEKDPNGVHRTALRKWALKSQGKRHLDAMVSLAQNDAEVTLDYRKLDADPLLVGVLNGVVDLRTGGFREGRREDLITMRCNVRYDQDATCPRWLEFQEKIAGKHDGLVAYKQRAAGLMLSGEVPEILFIAHGDGANGKTTELETIHAILRDYSRAAAADLLVRERGGGATPELVELRGKRAVFINETDSRDWLNEQRVKYLAGRDEMAARGLYERPVTWKPTHKPWMRTNHKPKIRGTDLGIWRRIHYVPYCVTISEEEKIADFRERFLVPEHAGIFNWMLRGWISYLGAGRKLQPPACVQEGNAAYKKEMDVTGRWIELAVEPARAHERVRLTDLYAAYKTWFTDDIGDKGLVAVQTLANALEARGYAKGHGHGGATYFLARLKSSPAAPERSGRFADFT